MCPMTVRSQTKITNFQRKQKRETNNVFSRKNKSFNQSAQDVTRGYRHSLNSWSRSLFLFSQNKFSHGLANLKTEEKNYFYFVFTTDGSIKAFFSVVSRVIYFVHSFCDPCSCCNHPRLRISIIIPSGLATLSSFPKCLRIGCTLYRYL